MKTEEIDGEDLQLVKFPSAGLFNYWADMTNDEDSIQNFKQDDDIDDDMDVTDWKEPVKEPLNSSREKEGNIYLYLFEQKIIVI